MTAYFYKPSNYTTDNVGWKSVATKTSSNGTMWPTLTKLADGTKLSPCMTVCWKNMSKAQLPMGLIIWNLRNRWLKLTDGGLVTSYLEYETKGTIAKTWNACVGCILRSFNSGRHIYDSCSECLEGWLHNCTDSSKYGFQQSPETIVLWWPCFV
jgi:hypothetical protein